EWPTSRRADPQRSRCTWDRRRPWLRPDNHVIVVTRATTAGIHLPEAEDRPLVAVPLDLRLRSKLAELSVVRACKPHPVHFLGLETLVVLLSPTGARTRLRSRDRKSTRLNSSHVKISYAVFCLKKKKTQ